MPFSRRVTLFIFGILLGSFFIWALLLRGRTFPAWTPEGRVLEQLRASPIKISQKAACQLQFKGLSNDDIVSVLNTADVNFSDSDIRNREIPEYLLEGKGTQGQNLKMKFRSEYLSTRLLEVVYPKSQMDSCTAL